MTSLDLSAAKACCKRHELQKYRRLGFKVEEVVEVATKLNALRALGVHLSIEGEGREGERKREGGREGGGGGER
jgi:hypothetical protein